MIGLCERFGCLPSQLLDEDARLLGLVAAYDRGRPRPRQQQDVGDY